LNSKRKKVALLAFLLTGAFAAGAAASNGIERVDAFLRPDFKLIVDGKTAKLDNPILVYNDTSYLPIREISGLLGADVNWNNSSNTAYVNSRFEGQPSAPVDNGQYREIEMKNPNPMFFKYLGKEYGVMTFYGYGDTTIYYRVIDLNRMGVNTAGVLKYRDKNTHDFYITEEDVHKLWKETPETQWSNGLIMSGIYDIKLQKFFQTMVDDARVAPYNSQTYKFLEPFTTVFFADALDDHPGYYSMYYWDNNGGTGVIILQVEKDKDGNFFRRSYTLIELQYMYKYFTQ
jgi:hypothetical protein